jgi:hypothetical protein
MRGALAALAVLGVGGIAHGAWFVTTGHTGAQVQADINHTNHWTYSVAADVIDVEGARFEMKRGSQTTASITFAIIEGTFADFGTATPIFSVTLTPSSFTQMFNPILFQGTGITLQANTVYTGVLYSNADDSQNKAYFIKQADQLSFEDESGNPPPSGGPSIIAPAAIPEPASLGLLAMGAVGLLMRRRR